MAGLLAHSGQNNANSQPDPSVEILSTVLNEAQTRAEARCVDNERLRRCTRDKSKRGTGSATIALAASPAYPSHRADEKGDFVLTRGSRGCCASVMIITLRNLCNNTFACSLFDVPRPHCST